MAVLKTTSPDRSAGAPKLLPSKTVPSSKARIADSNPISSWWDGNSYSSSARLVCHRSGSLFQILVEIGEQQLLHVRLIEIGLGDDAGAEVDTLRRRDAVEMIDLGLDGLVAHLERVLHDHGVDRPGLQVLDHALARIEGDQAHLVGQVH